MQTGCQATTRNRDTRSTKCGAGFLPAELTPPTAYLRHVTRNSRANHYFQTAFPTSSYVHIASFSSHQIYSTGNVLQI